MKYVIVLGDGMADEPIEELGGKTPLEYANISSSFDERFIIFLVTRS